MDGTPFAVHRPKADQIKAVKLTTDNIREVAGYMLATLGGGVKVESISDVAGSGIYTFNGDIPSYVGRAGDWLTETYDYVKGKAVFVTASIAQRQQYDLR